MKHISIRMALSIIVFILVIGGCWVFADHIRYSNEVEQKEILQNAVDRMITECYAMEGSYPPDIEYLVEHYGLTYDEDEYWIDYQYIASNLRPDVTIIKRN